MMKFEPENSDHFEVIVPPESREYKREKERARELRAGAWWKRKRATGICYYCRRQFPPAELSMDHVIPLSRGGKSVKENLVPCCKDCNNKKKNLLPIEWTEYLESLRGNHDP